MRIFFDRLPVIYGTLLGGIIVFLVLVGRLQSIESEARSWASSAGKYAARLALKDGDLRGYILVKGSMANVYTDSERVDSKISLPFYYYNEVQRKYGEIFVTQYNGIIDKKKL